MGGVLLLLPILLPGLVSSATAGAATGTATVVAAYREGRRDALLNGYGLPGIGTFLLRTPSGDRPALCLEADVAHTTAPGAYRPVPTSAPSPRLDYLLWRHLGDGAGGAGVDPDTATALAALAWFETGAVRRGGGAVWADPARGFAPVTPRTPIPWDALPRLTLAHPVGLRAGGRDLDAAERRVLELHLESVAHRGPWTLSSPRSSGDQVDVRLTGPAGPIPDRTVRLLMTVGGRTVFDQRVRTDATGTARVPIPPLDATIAPVVEASTIGPGPRQDWDGVGAVQRMATPTSVVLRAVATFPTTTTSTSTVPTIPLPPATAPATSTTTPPTPDTSTSTTVTTTTIDTTVPATVVPTSTLAGGETTILDTTTVPPTTSTTTTASTASTASSLPAPSTTVPTTTVAPPLTTLATSTTAVAAPVVPPAAPGPAATPSGSPPLPRTGSALARRVADAATVLLTIGLVLLAAGTGAVARRPRPRDGERH